MTRQPATRSNPQNCDALRSCTTRRGLSDREVVRIRFDSGHAEHLGIDVMCHKRRVGSMTYASMSLRARLGDSARTLDEKPARRADCSILQCDDSDMHRPDW